MAGLFDSFTLKGVTLRNRIAASPMCQYMANDGFISDWHQPHYASLARGGAGLVVVEATAVSPEGRITPGDLGIWNDAQVLGLTSVAKTIAAAGALPGIQLAHAGRKAGCTPPWEGGAPVPKDDLQAWQPIGPSAIPLIPEKPHMPLEMSLSDIRRVQQDFVDAAVRAKNAGFQWMELHFAHGFLGQSFLSRHSNQRNDQYGGSLENRARFLVDIVAAVREVWPAEFPLTARLGVLEYDGQDETNLAESMEVLRWLKAAGLDLVDVGIGFSTLSPVPWRADMLVDTADQVRKETGLEVTTSWLITDAKQADAFVREGKLSFVMFARRLLDNPHWPRKAAQELGIKTRVLPVSYAFWLDSWSAA